MGFSNCPQVLLSSEAKSGLYGPHTLVTLPIKLSIDCNHKEGNCRAPFHNVPTLTI